MSTKKRNKIVIIQKEIEKVDDHVEYRDYLRNLNIMRL